MRRIDKLHIEFPFAGSRILQALLRHKVFRVGRLHAATPIKRMGIAALYRKAITFAEQAETVQTNRTTFVDLRPCYVDEL